MLDIRPSLFFTQADIRPYVFDNLNIRAFVILTMHNAHNGSNIILTAWTFVPSLFGQPGDSFLNKCYPGHYYQI